MKIAPLFLPVLFLLSCGTAPSNQTYPIPEDYPPVTNTGTSYYIDSAAGNDTNDGLTTGSAWRTVAKANAHVYASGDSILFACGGVWRERIIPQSGAKDGWLVYGAYGSGAKPLFIGSVELNATNDWIWVSNQIWKWAPALGEDAGNLIFDNESSCGVKKWTYAAMSAQGDFYYDKSGDTLYLISSTNPATVYTDIECALGQHMIYRYNPTYPHMGAHGISNVIFTGLALRYGGAAGRASYLYRRLRYRVDGRRGGRRPAADPLRQRYRFLRHRVLLQGDRQQNIADLRLGDIVSGYQQSRRGNRFIVYQQYYRYLRIRGI